MKVRSNSHHYLVEIVHRWIRALQGLKIGGGGKPYIFEIRRHEYLPLLQEGGLQHHTLC